MAKEPGVYELSEVGIVYLFESSPKARKALAQLLDRSEREIDDIWRWCDKAHLLPNSDGNIKEQVVHVASVLGNDCRGRVKKQDDKINVKDYLGWQFPDQSASKTFDST